jgi:hypothetical protein
MQILEHLLVFPDEDAARHAKERIELTGYIVSITWTGFEAKPEIKPRVYVSIMRPMNKHDEGLNLPELRARANEVIGQQFGRGIYQASRINAPVAA